MIAFGCSITNPWIYGRCAQRGIERAAEPESEVIANAAAGSLARSYNLIMEMAAERDDLEALVLVHQDAEIVDHDFCARARAALADPDVGVAGCVGALDVRSIAWWEGSVTWASFVHRYHEYGGGDIESVSWDKGSLPPYARTGEVDTLDGFVLVLSPWVVRNVRFDESISQIHGYDFDFCLQVRQAARKVVTADFNAIHHHSLELVDDPDVWSEAHIKIAEKWDGKIPGVGSPNFGAGAEDWRARARHAEAQAGVARLERMSWEMKAQAREHQLQEQLDTVVNSTSWRLTAPLRRLTLLLKGARNGSGR